MKKQLLLLTALLTINAYGMDDVFFEGENSGINTVRLEKSIISTTGFQTDLKSTPNNVTVVTEKDIKEKGFNSVEDALESIPSIRIQKGSYGTTIDIRGQGKKARENVQILVDGINIVPLNKSHARMPLDAINIDNIQSIEVIPGGGSILYGSGSSGGVVNIITKSGYGMNSLNNIKMEAGSYNRKKVSGALGHNVTDNLLIQTNFSVEDGEGYVNDQDNESQYGEILAKYKINDKQDVSLKYSRYEEKAEGAFNSRTKEDIKKDRRGSGDKGATRDDEQHRDVVTSTYNNEITDNLKLSVLGSYQRTETDSNYLHFKGNHDNYLSQEEQIDLKPKLQFMYGNGSTLTLGYDYSYGKTARTSKVLKPSKDIELHDKSKSTKETHALFLSNKYKFNKFEFTQGIRYDRTKYSNDRNYYLNTDNNFSTKSDMDNTAYELALNYLYSDTGNAFVRWEKGFTTPSIGQLVNKEPGQIPEPSGVEAEKFDTYEIGIRDIVFDSYVSAAAFYTKKYDELYTEGGRDGWRVKNFDETERYGLELSAEQYLDKLTLTESYSYINAEITKGKNKGNYIPTVPKNSASLSAKYEFTHKLNTIVTSTFKDDVYINDDNSKGGKDNSYFITDIIVNYKLDNGIRLYAGINNLFGEEYYESTSYWGGSHKYTVAEGRNYYAGFSYEF